MSASKQFHGVVARAFSRGALTPAGVAHLINAEVECVENAVVQLVAAGAMEEIPGFSSVHCFRLTPRTLQRGCLPTRRGRRRKSRPTGMFRRQR